MNTALLQTDPRAYGFTTIRSYSPQYWFQWGNYLAIEPVPDDDYVINLFISDYPSSEMTLDDDTPSELPYEFWESIIDFALYVLSIKLERWDDVRSYYNNYVNNLRRRRMDYIKRKAEERMVHRFPDEVFKMMKDVDVRDAHKIPDEVVYKDGRRWAH